MPSLKESLFERNKLIEQQRALLSDDSKTATERNEQSDKFDKDIDALDAQIDEFRKLDEKRNRAEGRKLSVDPIRQTDRREPIPEKLAERLSLKFGKQDFSVARDSSLGVRSTDEYLSNYEKYLVTGRAEGLGLVTGKDDKGGYVAPVSVAQGIIKFVDDNVYIRKYATVINIEGNESLGAVSYDADPGDADWTAEVPASDISEDDTMAFGKRELRPHLCTKLVKASQKFLRTSGRLPGGAANWVASRLGYKFAITEEKNYLTGSGSQRPLGLFVASNDGIPTSRDVTCASTTTFTADEVINLFYNLKPQYQDRCVGLFSREFIKRARKLKTGDGQYLWGGAITGGQADQLMGRPFIQSENVPNTYTTGLYIGMFADLSNYWIVDSLDISIQAMMELFQLRNQVGWIGRREVDAMPVLGEAFSRLILA